MKNLYFRRGVGLVLINRHHQVFWGERVDRRHAWQFPQGGIEPGETTEFACMRELQEELGLAGNAVVCLKESTQWLYYYFPQPLYYADGQMVHGQRQRWFLLRFIGQNDDIHLNDTKTPEFRDWCWVDYEYPLQQIVAFKRRVYVQVLE